ncbi:MAG TPA: hypothetical protein VIE91_00090 [Methylophilaceae bacterium]|jgi:hypothetical protein
MLTKDTKIDYQLLVELSAFVRNARKEGFSFKPSQIVRDRDYCNEVLMTLADNGSAAINVSAQSIINKCSNLADYEINSFEQMSASL